MRREFNAQALDNMIDPKKVLEWLDDDDVAIDPEWFEYDIDTYGLLTAVYNVGYLHGQDSERSSHELE